LPGRPGSAGRPGQRWYGGITEADVPELVERHLIGGEPVEMLQIGP
jgi:(2Fe-2S) ferredoxin